MFALITLICYYIDMKKLKEIRSSKNLTYAEVASLLGITKSYYWKLENEKCIITYKMAFNIAQVFNLRPDDIFYEDFKEKSKEQ